MGIKEKMMDSMMSKMSPEEKKEMMEGMMKKFFDSMTGEEKSALMKDMMPKMMQHMMGGGLAYNAESEGESPMDMCKEMIQSMKQSKKISSIATPEINVMFEEWVGQVNEEILTYLRNKETLNIKNIAEYLKISVESTIYFIAKLAQSKKIDIDIKINEN